MLEPVEIDINMKQNVSEESERATQGVNNMTSSVDVLETEIDRLQKVVKDMSIALAEQEKLIESSNADFSEAQTRISGMREALEQANKELAAYRQTAEQANVAVSQGADVAGVMNDATQALADTEANLTQNAQNLIENQNDINNSLEGSAQSTDNYSASNQILSTALKRVTESLGIENTQIQNSVSSVHTISAAKKAYAAVVNVLTTQLGMSTLAAKALLVTGIGALLAGIALAIYAFKDWDKNTRDLTRSMEEFNKSAAAGAAKQRAEFEKLRQQWIEAGNDLEKKEKLVQKNITAYNEFGVQVNNVNDAERMFIDNADSIIESINKRAMAVAAMQMASKKYEEALQNMLDAEEKQANPSSWTKFKATAIGFVKGQSRFDVLNDIIDDEVDDLKTAAERANRDAQNYIAFALGTDKETTKEIQKGSKESYRQIVAYNQTLIDNMTDQQLKSADGRKAIQARDNAQKMLGMWGKTSTKANPADKAADSLAKKTYDYQKRINDARVKAIKEGAEREREAAKADYEATKLFIQKELDDIARLEKKTGKPATDQRLGLLELDVAATTQYENELDRINTRSKKEIDDIFTEVAARFSSELDQNITEIKSYYTNLIAEAQKAGASIEEVQRLKDAQKNETDRAGINDKLRKSDFNEALELEKAANLEAIGLTTIAEQTKYEITKKYLTERIKLLRALGDESSNNEADILEERLKGLQLKTAPKNITGLVNNELFKQISKGLEQTGMSAADANKKTSALFANIQKGGATASGVINELKGMFGGLDEGLDAALDSLGSIAEGFATGGIAGGVMATIGQGIKMFTQYRQVEKEHQKALKELALAKLELQRQYNLLLLKEQLSYKQGNGIFGTDQIRQAANAINTYRQTMKLLKEEMKGDAPTLNPFKAMFGGMGDYQKKLKAYNEGIGALANVDIVTGSKKSGALFWRKRKDVYTPLLEVYDDIIDKEGNLNTARIQSILNTHKMSDENKALLQSLLDLDSAAKEAEEQLNNYLSETFGSLGDALADSIVTAFKTGENAALLFKENVTSVLEDLAKQMVYTLYLKDTFDKLEKDIKGAYEDLASDKISEEQLSDKVTTILGSFFGGLDGDIEKANDFLDKFWQHAEANGFDRPQGERTGATGGLTTASQDSINELSGGVYAVRQMVGDIRNDNREQLLIDRTILTQLNILVERSEYWLFLEHLEDIKNSLGSMESYGLKMKA